MHTDAVRKSEPVQRARLDGQPAWLLNTRNTAVLLCSGPQGTLLLPYWGATGYTDQPGDYLPRRLGDMPAERTFIDGLPQAYPVHGDAAFIEPCLVVAREDGSRGVRLAFVEDRVSDEDADGRVVLELVFRDELIGLVAEQRFAVFWELDV